MAIDRYTKCLLTVIALCLIWMSLGGPALLPTAQAQQVAQPVTPTEVVLTGWKDSSGVVWRLPTIVSQPSGPFVEERALKRFNSEQALGVRLPVGVP